MPSLNLTANEVRLRQHRLSLRRVQQALVEARVNNEPIVVPIAEFFVSEALDRVTYAQQAVEQERARGQEARNKVADQMLEVYA